MSKILRRALVNRQTFDPENPQHIRSLKTFIATGNWGDVQFYVEAPYEDVPTTVLMRFASSMLNVERESEQDRTARFAQRGLLQVPPTPSRQAQLVEREARLARANALMTHSLRPADGAPRLDGRSNLALDPHLVRSKRLPAVAPAAVQRATFAFEAQPVDA